ncbi:hypothetical protein PGT21_003841 [Puccinia graminis f. sp. tritici]|uniref:Hydrophobin n=1 Tax=Puccinia graminis f. sp. tritici TaxID=56615 RepID=A0A5B0PWT6_PUCGR|nr:hypothetical protein PGTUg99_019419 [Puccinia graminis f. sp. tritici]KAA1105352.1 hypothetical protein PGT21_003841 [Puccinia graminis f. sp. tritici]
MGSMLIMLKALSLLLILVALFPDVSAKGKKPAKPVYDCKKYGANFVNPICCSVDKGTEGSPIPATGEAHPPGGGKKREGFGCGNNVFRFGMCCNKKVDKNTKKADKPNTRNRSQCQVATATFPQAK